MVSISTSGLELWGFEFFERPLVWGHKTRATIYLHISFFTPHERCSRVLESQGEKSKISARTLEQCGVENLKNPKTRFWTEAKSERLYNGVMLKISPTKGHKE